MLGSAESEEVRLISREIIFQEFQPICMTTIPQRYRQTKRQLTLAILRALRRIAR